MKRKYASIANNNQFPADFFKHSYIGTGTPRNISKFPLQTGQS